MVEITGNGRFAPSFDLTLPPGKSIPDGKPLTIAVISPFVLCRSHRHTPLEICSEVLGYQSMLVCHCRIEYLNCVCPAHPPIEWKGPCGTRSSAAWHIGGYSS